MDKCVLEISSMVPTDHMGDWTCKIQVWDQIAEATVTLQATEGVMVEFRDVWGDVTINVGKEKIS